MTRWTHVMLLSFALTPACGQVGTEYEDDPPEQATAPLDDAPLPAAEAEPGPVEPEEDEPANAIDWPLHALKIDVPAETIDAIAPRDPHMIFVGRRADHGVIVRLATDVKAGTTSIVDERDVGPIAHAITLGGERETLAVWHDKLGIGWSLRVDDQLASAEPTMILDPELDGQGRGPIALAPGGAGTLACTGVTGGPLRCTHIDRDGAAGTWLIIGKSPDMIAEALVPSPRGWLLLTSSCRPRSSEACRKKDLAVVRLDHDAETHKKRPPIALPPVEARRGGLVVVPTESGFILVARRVGAGETTAWRVSDDGARELDGKWSRVVGGLESDFGLAFVESAPIAMRKGFPVATFRLREWDDGARGDPMRWPIAVERLLPNTVDQRVITGDGMWTFIEPIRKGRVKGTIVRVGRVL